MGRFPKRADASGGGTLGSMAIDQGAMLPDQVIPLVIARGHVWQ